MATQEIVLKFRGDPSLLKGALNELKTAHASAMADVTRQQKAEAQAAIALQRQRSSALITVWKADTRAAVSEERARTRTSEQLQAQRSRSLIAIWKAEQREAVRIARETERQRLQVQQESDRKRSAFLSGAVGGFAALLGVSAISEIRAAGAAMLNYASTLETTTIAFTTMLGSAEAATQHLRELQAFALKTPFQFQELIAASQRMHALGIETAQVLPLLTAIGDAVASAGGGSERLDRVVLAIAQIQSKGKVATQELNQLAESGISGFKILESQLGKSRAELVKMVEAGQISSAVFLEAFQKFSQQNFGGLMEQQSKTFAGAMSNIKDALLQTSNTAFAPLYKRLSDLAQQFAETATKSKDFKDSLNDIGKVAATIPDSFIELVRIIKDAVAVVFAAMTQQVVVATHSFFALGRMIQSAVFALQAFVKFSIGDFIGAARAIENSNHQATLAFDELRQAAIGGGTVIREFGRIMEDVANRTEAAAVRIRVAAAMMVTQEAASGAGVVGGDVSVGAVGAGILRQKAAPIGTGGGGGGKSKQDEIYKAQLEASDNAAKKELETQRHLSESLKLTFDENRATLEEYYQGRQTLIDEHFNTVIDAINREQEAVDAARARGLIKAAEADKKDEDLTRRTTEAQNKLKEEERRISLDRQKAFDKAELDLNNQLAAIRATQREGELDRIEDLLDRQLITESEAIARRLAVYKEEHAERILLIDLELKQETTSAAKKLELDNQKIASEQKYTDNKTRLTQERIDAANREAFQRSTAPGSPGATAAPAQSEDEIARLAGIYADKIAGVPPVLQQQIDLIGTLRGAYEGLAGSIAQGVGQMVHDFVLLGTVGPQAFRKVLAAALATVAARAAADSIYELAIGFAALTPWGAAIYGPAVMHFKAAALLAGIALAAGAAGRITAGGAFQSATGGGGSSGSASTSSTKPTQPKPVEIDRRATSNISSGERIEVVLKLSGGLEQVIEGHVVNNWRSNGRIRTTVQTDGQG